MELALALAVLVSGSVDIPLLEVPLSDSEVVENPAVIEQFVTFGHTRVRSRAIDVLVAHSIFAPKAADPYSVDAVLALMKKHNVSAHYIIARDGAQYQLVREEDVSYHAGESRMPLPDGRNKVNRFSVGVEIINGYDDRPTEAQYRTFERLVRQLRLKYPGLRIVAHGEIAGERRSDPWNLDWERVLGW